MCMCGHGFAQEPPENTIINTDPMENIPLKTAVAPLDAVSKDEPIYIKASEMIYEQDKDIVTALGDVDILQEGRRLQANKVTYNVATDQASASGAVVLTDINGDVHMADFVELDDAFKQGFIRNLSSVLKDGSRVRAESGERVNANKIILKNAWYTPCTKCAEDGTPDWNVKADQVTLDEENKRVVYKNATFELFGVPVIYTPYLSHPDGTETQKSGFLSPRAGFGSQLGGFVNTRYYHAIAPDKDATTGLIVTGREGVVVTGQYRQRFEDAEASIGGTITQSTRPIVGGRSNQEIRGSVNGDGLWHIDNKWRAGYKVALASDDQYLRQYKLEGEDVLDNTVYAERFGARDYLNINAQAFQDTRVSRQGIDQPHVLPNVHFESLSEPKAVLGGRTKITGNVLGLLRDGNGQDMERAIGKAEWNKRTILPVGLVNDTTAQIRGDLYAVQDRSGATAAQKTSDTVTRSFAQVHSQMGYPMEKRLEKGSVVLEPRAALTLSQDVDDFADVPNEDSQDVDFSIAQLFSSSRFAGYDRIDDGTRITTGLSAQYLTDTGKSSEAFFGQSYRLSDDANPFPNGSGLSDNKSDYVGRLRYTGASGDTIEYNGRFDAGTGASQRQDVTLNLNFDPLFLGATYFYVAPLAGTDLLEDREQVALYPTLKLTDEWSMRSNVRYDLSGNDSTRGLQSVGLGFDYIGDCIDFSITANRNSLDEAAGTNETEVFFRLGFKNLAEIETSAFSFGERTDEDVNQ